MNKIISVWNESIKNHPEYRLGQTLFNALHEVYPDLANSVRGVRHLDPFYRDENIGDCLDFIAKTIAQKRETDED